MKVNMTPNPLDVVTIHASQGDTEARQWEFELHNNGELIDTSDVKEQLVFKAYKGGTEQLLPENGSTPTTSPFIGDIRYPQGLLTDQEFLYRQSPTEKDGNAKITDIKGNTLVWNQYLTENVSLTFETTNTSAKVVGRATGIAKGHKCLLLWSQNQTMTSNTRNTPNITYSNGATQQIYQSSSNNRNLGSGRYGWLFDAPTDNVNNWIDFYFWIHSPSVQTTVTNFCVFDLTLMFDAGKEPTTVEEFTSLFPLPYYSYNQGSLLSFNGNGIKTVSKNQFDTQVVTTSYQGLTLAKTQETIRAVYSGGSQYAGFNFYGSPVFTDTFLKGRYRLSFDVSGLDTQWTVGLRQGASFLGGGRAIAISNDGHYSFTIDTEANPNCYLSFSRTGNKTTAYDVTFSNIQLELGTTETSYTPFEEQTISLPISQYFPTGMKSAGNVYDELTENKAITRVGAVDLGSLNWDYQSSSTNFYVSLDLSKTWSAIVMPNIVCTRYATHIWNGFNADGNDKIIGFAGGTKQLRVRDSAYTSATAFKTAMSGVYLYYELATPTETSFTTASLVTENAEIPLSNNDGTLIGKCTEELSAESGFHDAKIKLSDSDGECYSNKLQLHVERSPQ